jgi:hypothetical protein
MACKCSTDGYTYVVRHRGPPGNGAVANADEIVGLAFEAGVLLLVRTPTGYVIALKSQQAASHFLAHHVTANAASDVGAGRGTGKGAITSKKLLSLARDYVFGRGDDAGCESAAHFFAMLAVTEHARARTGTQCELALHARGMERRAAQIRGDARGYGYVERPPSATPQPATTPQQSRTPRPGPELERCVLETWRAYSQASRTPPPAYAPSYAPPPAYAPPYAPQPGLQDANDAAACALAALHESPPWYMAPD